jgi:hypothetical protein
MQSRIAAQRRWRSICRRYLAGAEWARSAEPQSRLLSHTVRRAVDQMVRVRVTIDIRVR